MRRKTIKQVALDPNLRCQAIYPIKDTKKKVEDLETVGIRLNRKQAIHLARLILAASQDWDEFDITAFRKEKRKSDGTFRITVTSKLV